ncbi:unnamed protein product [Ostreobium quekettii]|uniref:GTP 3',8-cyclase n=1 Tax=Ostreobium quekettii TaxID=121088 RepID=A0A8S1J411_9CHLO|nr:unnamed protein product [Ostreobium quekettii]|eukprot:evm.model.scf_771.4 EVM.evm.TU.scf_771.4   scf_771:27363-33388(-)
MLPAVVCRSLRGAQRAPLCLSQFGIWDAVLVAGEWPGCMEGRGRGGFHSQAEGVARVGSVEEAEQRRRLGEMMSAGSIAGGVAGMQVLREWAEDRAGGEEGGGRPGLDWRVAVEMARRREEAARALALTDTFGRHHSYLRISLTERCNLRCQYCMPAEGVDLTPKDDLLTTRELLRLAQLFVANGVNKIRLTGGEPTVRKDIVELTGALARIPGLRTLAMTTNGLALTRKLPALKEAGLNALNISLDTLRPDRFEKFTRRRGHDRVLQAIDLALELGYDPVKVNVVVMRDQNDDEILDFVELTREKAINVRFIEFMPFDGNLWSGRKLVSYNEMFQTIASHFPGGPIRCADPKGEVAKNFRIPGFKGSLSFVTSMTKAFCGDCNRVRLMADGNLKVCLFGANEVSLREAMRDGASDDELRTVIWAAIQRKKAAHAGMFELSRTANRAMIKIGG